MWVESGGDERVISPKGAMGLVQIMPKTWVELSVRYRLGLDPFDPHDNILAGTAYLREMHDRFGSEGFLAAYHAGPQRYEQHLTTGRPLPAETLAYVAALIPLITSERIGRAAPHETCRSLAASPLFVEQVDSAFIDSRSASNARLMPLSKTPSTPDPSVLAHHATGLFVRRSGEMQSQ
jgi:hypothetical protein